MRAKKRKQKKIMFLAKNTVPGNTGISMEIKRRKHFLKKTSPIAPGPDGTKQEK